MLTKPSFRIASENEFALVLENESNGQKSLHARVAFQPGDRLCSFSAGMTLSSPTYLTVQVGHDQHITLRPEFLQYINHSCRPNVFFDTSRLELLCLNPIEAGDEFTFFYPSTEWDMAQPFICQCGEPGCLQLIQGAAHLSADTLARYRLTDFIQQQLFGRSVAEAVGQPI